MIWLKSHYGGGAEFIGPMPIGFEDLNQPITMDTAYPWPLPPLPDDPLISGSEDLNQPITMDTVYPWPLPDDGPDASNRLISGFEDLGQPVGFEDLGFEDLGFEDLGDMICL